VNVNGPLDMDSVELIPWPDIQKQSQAVLDQPEGFFTADGQTAH